MRIFIMQGTLYAVPNPRTLRASSILQLLRMSTQVITKQENYWFLDKERQFGLNYAFITFAEAVDYLRLNQRKLSREPDHPLQPHNGLVIIDGDDAIENLLEDLFPQLANPTPNDLNW